MSQAPSPSSQLPLASRLILPAVLSLTLGLAPFSPEPHLIGKLRWVAGGAVGMGMVDWGDLALHGAPWLWLGAVLVMAAVPRVQSQTQGGSEDPPAPHR